MDSTTEFVSVLETTASDVAVNLTSERTLKIVYFCIGAFGLLGNTTVLLALGSSKTMRKHRTNVLIINQSMVDFMCALFLILTNALEEELAYNDPYCQLWKSKLPLWSMLLSSTYSLLLTTMDRYLAIVHPIWHMNNVGTRPLAIAILCVWIIGPLYNSIYMVPTSSTRPSDGHCQLFQHFASKALQQAFGVLTFALQFLIPIAIHIFCYLRMVKALWMRVAATNDEQRKNSKKTPMRNVVKTLILVTVCFTICWIFNQVYYLLFNLGARVDFTSRFYHFTVIAVFCNCCINPIVYLLQYRRFQKRLLQIFCRKHADGSTAVSALATTGQ